MPVEIFLLFNEVTAVRVKSNAGKDDDYQLLLNDDTIKIYKSQWSFY